LRVGRFFESWRVLTFCGKQLLLRGGLFVDAIERERELLGLVLGAGDLDDGQWLPLLDAVRADDDIFALLFFKQRTNPGNNANRHAVN
jgi:hypothetical protein